MKVAAFTCGNVYTASSRLRSFYIFSSQVWRRHSITFNPEIWSFYKYDCLHFQKKYTPRFLLIALLARAMQKAVIFDIDDQVIRFTHRISVWVMIFLSSAVTTDTKSRRTYLRKKTRKRSIYVIPDALDAEEKNINIVRKKEILERRAYSNSSPVIIWVGHQDNFDSFKMLVESDPRLGEYEILIFTNSCAGKEIRLSHVNYTVKAWSLDWPSQLSVDGFYYMLLNHNDPNCLDALYKSDNKMATAIFNLIIPIVSKTPSYYSLAKCISAEFLVYDQPSSVYDTIKKIDSFGSAWKKYFFESSLDYVLKRYSNKIVSANLLRVLENI